MRGIVSPEAQDSTSYRLELENWKLQPNVRFGSKADMCSAKRHGAKSDVRLVPIADIGSSP
jgi:hypothetical protein